MHDECCGESGGVSRRRVLKLAQGALAASAPMALLGSMESAFAQTGDQGDWRFCNKCRAMFWNGIANKGNCPAGGGHVAQGFLFSVHYDSNKAGTHQLQYDWRFCQKCMSLFWDGSANKGRCSAGGGHVAQGLMFGLDHQPPAGQHQRDWRFCDKCYSLFWDGGPEKGRCPAGGGHRAQGFMFHMIYKAPGTNLVQLITEGAQAAFNATSPLLAQLISAELGKKNLICGGCSLTNNIRFGPAQFGFNNPNFSMRINGNYMYARLRNDTIIGSWADPAVEVHFDLAGNGGIVLPPGGKPYLQSLVGSVPSVRIVPRTASGAALTTLVRFVQLTGPGGRLIQQLHDTYLKRDFANWINNYLKQWV